MKDEKKQDKLALWSLTPNGIKISQKIAANIDCVDQYCSQNLDNKPEIFNTFISLNDSVSRCFNQYKGHVFIMSTGIAVRVIAPFINCKTKDPAVLTIDDAASYVISLLSGHLGGANSLARKVATLISATPVITTATDVNSLPSVDMLAQEKDLLIENPHAIKQVSIALIKGEKISLHDPFGFFKKTMPNSFIRDDKDFSGKHSPGIFIDDVVVILPAKTLILRPKSLVAGLGCHRNTGVDELKEFLFKVLKLNGLSTKSLKCLACIDVKSDEKGLLDLGESLNLPIAFFNKKQLNLVDKVQNQSLIVQKHVGAKSVCEAAAILAANHGNLIVPKKKTSNITVAVARIGFTS